MKFQKPDFIETKELLPNEAQAITDALEGHAQLKDSKIVSIIDLRQWLDNAWGGEKGILACFVAPQRYVYDWRDNPPQKPKPSDHSRYEEEELPVYVDTCELDKICKTALISPTFRALVHSSSYVQGVPVYYDADERRIGEAFFDPEEAIVGLPYHQWKKNNMYPALLAHEMRHAWQDERALTVTNMFPILLHIALRRINEADCTAMMITVAAEIAQLSGNHRVLKSMRDSEVYAPITAAFLNTMRKDSAALWSGMAQRAALLAYLQFRPLLNTYDLISLEEEIDFLNDGKIPEVRLAKKAFTTLVNRHFSMPYEDGHENLCARQHYSGLRDVITPNILLRSINPAIRQKAKRLDYSARAFYQLLDAPAPDPF